MIDFRFIKDKLRGFRLRVVTRIKSFDIFCDIRVVKNEPVPLGYYGRYTQISNTEGVEFFREFHKYICD